MKLSTSCEHDFANIGLVRARTSWSIAGALSLGLFTHVAVADVLDTVVVRWFAPEIGGSPKPQFIFARELAFGARLEALAAGEPDAAAYRDRFVRAALDRHIAEALLAQLPIEPEPAPKEVAERAEETRATLEQRVHGRDHLAKARLQEGVSTDELDALLRRRARASFYLDRMVAPMLKPSELELRALHKTGTTPFRDQPFERVSGALERWFISERVTQSLDAYYQNVRSRVTVIVVQTPR